MGSGPALPLNCCVTLGKFLPLSGPQFSSLYNVMQLDSTVFYFLLPTPLGTWDFQLSLCRGWGWAGTAPAGSRGIGGTQT